MSPPAAQGQRPLFKKSASCASDVVPQSWWRKPINLLFIWLQYGAGSLLYFSIVISCSHQKMKRSPCWSFLQWLRLYMIWFLKKVLPVNTRHGTDVSYVSIEISTLLSHLSGLWRRCCSSKINQIKRGWEDLMNPYVCTSETWSAETWWW